MPIMCGGEPATAVIIGHRDDFPDLEYVDAEQFGTIERGVMAEAKEQQFQLVGAGQVGSFVNFLLDRLHG